jgi:hypothetical protein
MNSDKSRFYVKIIAAIVILAIIGTGWGIAIYYMVAPEKVKIVKKTEIQYKTVYRDYAGLPDKELIEKLYHYDTDKPTLDAQMINNTMMRINAGLYERTWDRDVQVTCVKTENWRVTVGVSAAAFVVGGIIGGMAGYHIPHNGTR